MAGPWEDYGQSNDSGREPWSEYGDQPAEQKSGIGRRLVGDTAISALKSAIAVPEAAVGIADLVTGGRAGKSAEQAGFRPKEAKSILDGYLSPEQKAANAKLDQAEGFVDTATTALQNPSTIIHTGVESIAPMLAGGVVARGVMAAPGIAGKVAPWVAGAVGEGTIGAGMGAESIRQQTEDGLLTGEQAGLAALSGVGTSLIGAGGAKVANKLGIGEIDTLLAGGGAGQATGKGVARKAAEGAVVEGVLQELPQSAQETALQNIALERPWDEGLGEAAAMGLLTGTALGGIAGPLGSKPLVQPQPSAENPAPAPVPAPDPNAGAISRTAALLPAPSIAGLLPNPGSTLYGDTEGNWSPDGQPRNFDRDQFPTGRERGPQNFGPGMDQQTELGAQAGIEGDYIPRSPFAPNSQSLATQNTFEGERTALADTRPQGTDSFTVDAAGNAVPGKVDRAPTASYVQGGRGMDQQTPAGKTYNNIMAAKKAVREAAEPKRLEVVKVGEKKFEVRPTVNAIANSEIAIAKPKGARKTVDREKDTVMQAAIRLGGIKTEWRQDTTGDNKGNKNVPGVGALWSDKTGTSIDDMASLLDQSGYVPAGEMERDGGVSWLQRVLQDEASGTKQHFAPGSKRQEEETIKAEAQRQADIAAQQEDDGGFDSAESVVSDLLDDADMLEIRAAAAEKFAADLDVIFGDTPDESVTSAPSADSVTEEAQQPEAGASGSTGSGQRPAGSGTVTEATGSPEASPSLTLASQTEAELAAADAANKARIKAEEKARADADAKKRKADEAAFVKQQNGAAADNFQLGQSADDNISGQGGMFDAPTSNTPADQAAVSSETVTAPAAAEASNPNTASWVIRNKETGEVIAETYDRKKVEALNTEKYEAVPIAEHLSSLSNKTAKAGPQDDWRANLMKARMYANQIGVPHKGKTLTELVAEIDGYQNPVAAPQSVAEQLANMNVNDLAALIDDVSNEVAAPQTSKPKAKRSNKAKTAEGKPRLRATKSKAENTDTTQPAEVSRAAGAIAKSMGVNMSKAGMNALEGLTQLFGGPGRLNSGLSFDEETYAKAKPYFAAAMADVQAAGKDLRDFIRALVGSFGDGVKPYILRYAQDMKQEQDNGSADNRVESDRAADAEPGTGADVRGQEPGQARPDDRPVGEQGDGAGTGNADGVSDGRAAADGKRSDRPMDGEQSAVEASAAGSVDGGRGGSASTGGLYAERDTDQAADRAAEQAVAPKKANVKASNSPATLAEIKQQLPFLTEGQIEDVVFAEKRLMQPDGYGVLYTNGTGTGKTFTGLGVMARSAARGKDNILVVAPKQTIVDAWVKAAKGFFGLGITALKDTQDNGGSGIVATTYANLAANNSLALRDWDMVVADEAHYLSSAEDGANTGALTGLRALTMRRGFARELVRMQHPDKVDAIERLNVEAKAARVEEKNALSDRLQAQASAIHAELDVLTKAKAEEIAAIAPIDKPRAVFLSATPFAYEKNVAWAQGFLFDWGVAEDTDGQAYNSGGLFERFMMQHFGYRMRYNKLTAPDAKVDSGLMQRAFNSWLKREGALSARALDSEFDYDRLFVTVDSQIGRRVDDALKWLWNMSSGRDLAGNDVKMSDEQKAAFSKVNERIAKDNFNYHARMYFLEAIKAREALPHIRAQLAAGRKVLVMHDFKKGGAVNPFRQTFAESIEQEAYEQFAGEFSDLIRAFSSLPSPIDQLSSAFPDALVYNGSVSPKLRIKMQNDFNSDEDGAPRVMIAQGDAMREGVSIHDTSGKHPRVLVHLGMPVKPTASIQQEGRIYRTGQASNALFRYFTIGTSWERSAFASKIATRAGAAENLAMGEQARGLKQAFIDAYENADLYEPGFEGEGLGGKATDRAAAAALTPWDMAKSYYFGTKKQGAGRAARGREGTDYFATPEPIGLKMVEWADIRGGESVLEPSAGHGAIARWFPDNATVRVIEDSAELASRVALHVDGDVVHGRFEDHNIVNKYDAVVMNPPYGMGGSVAIPHLAKAADHLRAGGRVVALIPTGPAADKKFDSWFYGQDKNGNSLHPDLHLVGDVKMPAVTFERAGTAAATRLVIIERVTKEKAEQLQPARTADLSSISDIGELFERMENMEMRARVKPIEEEAEQTAPAKSIKEKAPKQSFAEQKASETDKYTSDEPIIEHVTAKGKTLRGIVVRDMDLAEVKEKFYEYAFKKDGGVFLREEFIERPISAQDAKFRKAGLSSLSVVRGEAPSTSITLEQAQTAAQQFLADYNGNIEIAARVRKTQYEHYGPEGTVAKIGVIKGAYHPGAGVFTLTADHLSDTADARETLRHEILGHYGLDTFAPADKQALLDTILASKKEPSLKTAWDYVSRVYADKTDLVQAEEVFAHLAEGPRTGLEKLADLLQSVLARLLRKVFKHKRGIITRAELMREIEVISKGIRNGTRPRQTFQSDEAEAFSRSSQIKSATGNNGEFDGGNPDIRYRLTDTNTKGIPPFSAKAIAKKVTAATGLNAVVVNNESELPADLQAQIKRDKAAGRVAGIYHNGTAYLVASNLRDTQHAISVALHEAIGHGGVQSVLGANLGKVMRDIYRDMPKAMRSELERRYAGQMAGMNEADAQSMIAEEYVAHLAEADPQHGIISRLVALLRKFIRDTFGDAAALKWSRNDLVQLLAEARGAARGNDRGPKGSSRYRAGEGALALASLPEVSESNEAEFVASLKGDAATRSFANAMYKARGTESPFFKGWFGKSRMVDKQGEPIAFVHRSYGERDTFEDADLGKNTGTPTATLGHFLARKDVGNVERYGPVVEQFYIRMTKPKVVTQDQFEAMGDWSPAQVKAYKKTLMDQGHDGMYIQGLAWPIVFEGKNIKAKRNTGTFDETASTRYSLKQTATAAFKKWFGDSEVVDANGEPLVFYHGGSAAFSGIKPGGRFDGAIFVREGKSSSYGDTQHALYIKGPILELGAMADKIGVSPGAEALSEAVGRSLDEDQLEAVAAALTDGSNYPDDQGVWDSIGAIDEADAQVEIQNLRAKVARALGYHAVRTPDEFGGQTVMVLDPSQIKSATGNNGEFDGSNPDIRYSLNPADTMQAARDLFDRATGPAPLDNNDPFAVENRRLREGEKTLWDKAKKVFARQFAPGGLLPSAVFDAKITRDSEFQAVEFDVRHLAGGLNTAVKADYGVDLDDLTAEQMKPLAEALTGKVDPTIPEATRVAIVAMRQYIDSLSGEYLQIIQGQIEASQERAATFGPALKAANDARKALNAAIASDSDPAIMQALAGKKAALAEQVKAKKAMDGLKGEPRAQAKAAYEAAVRTHDQAKAALRASLSPELKAQAKAAEALSAEANADRSATADAAAESALYDKITSNLGAYVNRSYQAFDDPNWFKTVPTEVVNAARTYLANGYIEQGETAAEARRLADVTVNEMLKNGTAYDSMGAFIAEGKLGAKDLTVLIKRKQIAPEIRALLGEYMDPRLNFAKSATKMGRLVWNQRFLDRVLDFGMGTLFFEGKNRPADATTQMAGEQSASYAPLNGLWTFPEVAQAFEDAMGPDRLEGLYATVVRLNGMVKYGKTILSPTTAMRNWQSAMFFSLANGHFDLTQMKKSWAAMREQVTQNATGDDLVYLRKLKQLGVVYDTPYAGEMMALLQDARMDELLSSKSGTGLKWLRKANQFAQGFYSFGDDFWKIIGYENEKASLIGAGIPEAEAEVMAAKRIRDTYPTYSMIGKAVQWLRRFPLAGTFVSFPSEIIRTSVNMLQLVQADLKSDNPKIRALGRKRALGMAMVSGGFYALSAMTAAALGVGDDEEEALRDLAAPWSKNSTFLYAGRDADGKLRYFDLSFLDPYGYFKRPLTAMMRDQSWEDAAVSGLSDLLSPFFGADITAGAIFEVMANKKPTGGQVFNPNAGSVDQLQDITNHMRKALQPGFASNIERLWLAGSEARREGSGQPYEMRDELVSLLGWRASTLDTQTGLYYRSFDFTDGLTNAKKTLTRTLRSSNDVSEGDIREAKEAANAQYQQAFTEMSRLVSSAQAAGMSRSEVMQTLKLSGVAQRNIFALINGRVPPMDIGMQAQAKAVRQAVVMRDREYGAEIAQRFRMAREL